MVAKKTNTRVTPKKPDTGVRAEPTSASQWKKSSSVGTPIRVPSGNTALVRRPGMHTFVAQGIIPNSLMAFVTESLKKGAPKPEELNIDTQTMKDLVTLVDKITVECCIEPKVQEVPVNERGLKIEPSYRDPNILYVDEVDFEDKMFIFNYAVGGVADVDSFRKEFAASMDNISPS